VAVLAFVAVGNVVLWVAARPGGPPGRFVGELCGVEAVLLLSCSLVLATLLPVVERFFGGLDRVVKWHRRVAVAGVLLLVPHLALVTSPPDPFATTLGHGLGDVALAGLLTLTVWAFAPRLRAARWPGPVRALARTSYEHWLTGHRLTGLFVAVAVGHGAIVDPVMRESSVLRAAFLVVGAVGVAAYVYRELFARYVVPIYDYTVDSLRRMDASTVEVKLDPVGKALSFTPGQFIVLAFGGLAGWQRHPFSISSGASDRRLDVTIKASGDYTSNLLDQLRPGVPAKLAGPFGGFDSRAGGPEQLWIAGGIGVTPFMSWVRSLDGAFDRSVDLYYSVEDAGEDVYRDELEAAATRYPSLRTHLVYSVRDGRLTADEIMRTVQPRHPWIYMCGPPQMMTTLSRGFRRLGVPAGRIRWEQFNAR
jgi:predicted ferric reductase